MLLNISAPIVPFEGVGGIRLYSTRKQLSDLLQMTGNTSRIVFNDWIQYNIQDTIELLFHMKNDKLFRITTLEKYQGKLFGKIGIGITEHELLKAEPSFVYDDFEEVWESARGAFIEMDAETNTVKWISVYIKELADEDFEEAKW